MLNRTEISDTYSNIQKIVLSEVIIIQAVIAGTPHSFISCKPHATIRCLMNILEPGEQVIIGFAKYAPILVKFAV